MSRHDAADAGGHRGAEGNEFKTFEPLAVRGNHRQINMRIRGSVTVPRKMFGRREPAIFFDAAHERRNEFSHACGIFSKGTRIDDGISGIIVYIGHRRIARLERGYFSHGVGVRGIAGGGKRHRGGE